MPCPDLRPRRFRPRLLAISLPLLLGSCLLIRETEIRQQRLAAGPEEGRPIELPLRAHMTDGSIAVYPAGAWLYPDSLRACRRGPEPCANPATLYRLALTDTARVSGLLLAEMIGVETYRGGIRPGASLAASLGLTALTVGGIVAIACAADPKCFGSCPTVYSGVGADTILEAELFSYSIAPLLEGRDVDALGAAPVGGVLRLDVRNEALETHFLNHLELLVVTHEAGERVLPDPDDRPLAVTVPLPPAAAIDLDGRDLRVVLAGKDDSVYETTEARLAEASAGGSLSDVIELGWPKPEGVEAGDTVAVVVRMRNSLLTSVLFYELMLGRAGPAALEWLGGGLAHIGTAVELGAWWSERMGLRVWIQDGASWRQVARVADSGPIAWSEVAVPVSVASGDSIRIRLDFAADQWRIDAVGLSVGARYPDSRSVPVARVEVNGAGGDAALAALLAPDEEYFETTAGTRFGIEFDVGPEPTRGARSFLLASQGYYNEWMRPAWLTGPGADRAFRPSDETLREAMRIWRPIRPEFERHFHATRIPVR